MKKEELSWKEYKINKEKHKYHKRVYKIEQQAYEQDLAKQYFKHNTRKYFWLKIIIIFAILSNMGALLATNATVVKTEPTLEVFELNPAACGEGTEWECHPATSIPDAPVQNWVNYMIIIVWVLFRPAVLAAAMIYLYQSIKISSFTHNHFYMNSSLIVFMMITLTYDLVNDLGYWIGLGIWG